MTRMTDERLAKLTEPPWGGTPLERELLQALKAERDRVSEQEAQHKRELAAAMDAVTFWQNALDKSEERLAELEAENERLRQPVVQARMNAEKHLTTVQASVEYLRMQKRAEAAERKLDAVAKEAKHLTKTFRMPNIEHVADRHNQAVDWLQALGGDDE